MFYRCKEKLKFIDQDNIDTRHKFYNVQVKYIECMTEIKNKNKKLKKMKIHDMRCKLNAVYNQRLAKKYQALKNK